MAVVAGIVCRQLGVRELELTASDDVTPYNYRLIVNENDYTGSFIVEYKDSTGNDWQDIHVLDFFEYDTINEIVHNFPVGENGEMDKQIRDTVEELLSVYKKSVATLILTKGNVVQPTSTTNYTDIKFGTDKLIRHVWHGILRASSWF